MRGSSTTTGLGTTTGTGTTTGLGTTNTGTTPGTTTGTATGATAPGTPVAATGDSTDRGARPLDRRAESRSDRRRDARTDQPDRRAGDLRAAGTGSPPVDEPAVTVAPLKDGTLRVDWSPWAMVSLNGRSMVKTPVNERLPPGEYQVSLEVSANGGRFETTARIESGKLTKCRENQGQLRCEPPR
jgi:hypothetical protein